MIMAAIINCWMLFIYRDWFDGSCQSNPSDYCVDFWVFAAVALTVIEFQAENRYMSQPNLCSQAHRDYSFFTLTNETFWILLLQYFYSNEANNEYHCLLAFYLQKKPNYYNDLCLTKERRSYAYMQNCLMPRIHCAV